MFQAVSIFLRLNSLFAGVYLTQGMMVSPDRASAIIHDIIDSGGKQADVPANHRPS
ncbi:MAG: hypothetical protein H8M99_13990 [Gloeobacteraceae cyanobacterium ES-bin-144]|nr:hypothetical protein [Verrucomicrobiales bacterium]